MHTASEAHVNQVNRIADGEERQLSPRARYDRLIEERNRLQAEKADCELAFKQIVLDVSLYSDEQIRLYRERYPVLTAELECVVNEIDELLQDETFRAQLEREFSKTAHNKNSNAL